MRKYQTNNHQQLELLEREVSAKQPAKRVNIVSLKLVRESSVLYRERQIKSPEDAYKLLKPFLVEADREKFVVVCLDTKNQPTAINICHVGSLNASIVHPREVMKAAILSNSASIIVAHKGRVPVTPRNLSKDWLLMAINFCSVWQLRLCINFCIFDALHGVAGMIGYFAL